MFSGIVTLRGQQDWFLL